MEETLEQKLARLESENAQLRTDKAEAEQVITTQAEALANAEAATSAAEVVVVTHEKKQYRVLAPKFSHKGAEITASNLQANKELLAELVKMKSGVLQLVVKEEAKS